jgi:hypothetical protein
MGAEGSVSIEPAIAFRVRERAQPGIDVRVNFGLLTGRTATQAEIDDLARALRGIVPSFEIVSEERHEFGTGVEATVHQVLVEIAQADDDVAIQVVDAAERWARSCFAARHSDLTEI